MSKVQYPIKFYPNTEDDTHCHQAVIRSVLDIFLPQERFSAAKLDEITHKLPGMWTWPTATMVWLHDRGFDVKMIEEFDNVKFAKNGEKYLQETFGDEVANEQIKFSDIVSEQKLIQRLVKTDIHEQRSATFEDIDNLISENWLVVCSVNSNTLDEEQGYVGHVVLIKEIDIPNCFVIFNDPGLPPVESRRVALDAFEQAWEYTGDKSLFAFRKHSSLH